MVIGYNPSHSNVNSEVNAPFKILSLMLRYLENENAPKKGGAPKKKEGEEEKSSLMAGYKMRRDFAQQEGERLDTIDQGDDDDELPPADFNDSEGEGQVSEDEEDERRKRAGAERIEVNLDEVPDEEENLLFAVKESHDRGLADMETGSEVYMSELLVRARGLFNIGGLRHGGLRRGRGTERRGPARAGRRVRQH